MLRRKLLISLGPPILLLLGAALAVILPIQSLIEKESRVHAEAWGAVERANDMGALIATAEGRLRQWQHEPGRHQEELQASVHALRLFMIELGSSDVVREAPISVTYQRTDAALVRLERAVAALAPPVASGQASTGEALAGLADLRRQAMPLPGLVRQHARQQYEELTHSFRRLVLVLCLVFLLVINGSVLLLMRAAQLVLRPVERLVDATGQLAQEQYDCRVHLDGSDEFGQLAEAYNRLAGQLQQNEARKIEMIGQVALTMNHELNNAMAIIDLQLEMVRRQSGDRAALHECLKQIRTSLGRMTASVHALKNVRRIVLVDYAQGEKMLDLDRSSAENVA